MPISATDLTNIQKAAYNETLLDYQLLIQPELANAIATLNVANVYRPILLAQADAYSRLYLLDYESNLTLETFISVLQVARDSESLPTGTPLAKSIADLDVHARIIYASLLSSSF